jgi:hypothetical protein
VALHTRCRHRTRGSEWRSTLANTAALESSPAAQAEDELPQPSSFGALKHAIAKDDFGVVLGDDGGNPAPPLAAVKAYKAAGGTLALDRNTPLPPGFYILQVRPSPQNLAAGQLPGFPENLNQ